MNTPEDFANHTASQIYEARIAQHLIDAELRRTRPRLRIRTRLATALRALAARLESSSLLGSTPEPTLR